MQTKSRKEEITMQKRKHHLHNYLVIFLIVIIFIGWVKNVQSQGKYPSRAIDLICPFAPGAATDVVGRVFADALKRKWDVPVNVINKAGGNSVPANLEVYKASPDGYTLLIDSQSSCSMLGAAIRNLPFNVMDRTFIAIIAGCPQVFIVPSTSPIQTMKEIEAEAKRDPESFTWASLGGAGMQDYGTRQFLKAIGVDVTKTKPIMFPGGAPAVAATAGGHLKLGSSTTVGVLPAFKAGTVRPLGITGKTRHPDFPNVPTMEELGYPTVTCYYWNGFSGPPKLPSSIVEMWNKELQELSKNSEFLDRVKKVGGVPFYHNASEAKEYIMKEIEDVNKLWGLK
jgi:tripartite-type tricarboxylate transporter receptor subunit TctC